jgi:RNA polymerase sigma-70 factor, ECF subfamily
VSTQDQIEVADKAMALALQQGDEAVFGDIVSRFQGRVYSVAYRYTANREDALDVTQEALLRVYQKIHTWKPTGHFGAWVMRVATNTAIDHRRGMTRKCKLVHTTSEDLSHQHVDYTTPEDTIRKHEISAAVYKAMEQLSVAQRKVFVLRHYEHLPLKDIAKVLDCSVGSIKVHLYRALRKLRDELADSFEELS